MKYENDLDIKLSIEKMMLNKNILKLRKLNYIIMNINM